MSEEMHDEIPAYLTKKRTIMKARVGCVRSTTYDLPPESFVYGVKANDPDAEGAGDGEMPSFVYRCFFRVSQFSVASLLAAYLSLTVCYGMLPLCLFASFLSFFLFLSVCFAFS